MKSKNLPFIVFFLYFILQGALRKWYFPSLGTPLLLFQYVLVYYFYLSIRGKKIYGQPNITPEFQWILTVYVIYSLMEVFNVRGTDNFIVQVYGFLMHFSFVPLVYYMSKVFVDDKTLDEYLLWLTYILIPLFSLGFVQFFSPKEAFINKYAVGQGDEVYEVAIGAGGRVRITGTFSFLATYASFICFILHFIFYAMVTSLMKGKLNIIFVIVFAMGVINIFMTGSRGSVVTYGITEGLVVVYLMASGQVRFIKNLIPLSFILILGYFVVISTEAGSTAIDDFFKRLFGLNDLDTRFEDSLDPFKFIETTGFFGFGIGTAQFPMEPYLTNRNDMPGYWEEESERIVIELGAIGFVLVMACRYVIFIACFRMMRKIKKLENKILALQMTLYQAPFLINIQTNIFNYIDAIFYWMAVGTVFFAYTMDRMKSQKIALESSQQDLLNQT